jgi:hypothetical protein
MTSIVELPRFDIVFEVHSAGGPAEAVGTSHDWVLAAAMDL